MIRNEGEYQEAKRRVEDEKTRLAGYRTRLEETDKLSPIEVKQALDPFTTFHLGLVEEVKSYERLSLGDFGEIRRIFGAHPHLQDIGRLLIAIRIVSGKTQSQLAALLGMAPSQVCRDERNEYHSITIDRASRILNVLGVGDVLAFGSRMRSTLGRTRATEPSARLHAVAKGRARA